MFYPVLGRDCGEGGEVSDNRFADDVWDVVFGAIGLGALIMAFELIDENHARRAEIETLRERVTALEGRTK